MVFVEFSALSLRLGVSALNSTKKTYEFLQIQGWCGGIELLDELDIAR